MKRLFVVLVLTVPFLMLKINGQTVLNHGFEEFNSDKTLKYWGNVYIQLIEMSDSLGGSTHTDTLTYDQGYYYRATSEAHSGSSALLLSNAYSNSQNKCIAGAAGVDDDSVFSAWGLINLIPLQERVGELSFYYKFLSVNGDSAQAKLTLWDSDGNSIGEALAVFSTNQSVYQYKAVPVKYSSTDAVAYYSLNFSTFYSKSSTRKPNLGTRLWIDDVALSATANVLTNYKNKFKIRVFPNPAKSMLSIQSEIVAEKQFYIYGTLGQVIQLGTMSSSENSISIEDLKSGVYMLELVSEKGREAQRFVVDHE